VLKSGYGILYADRYTYTGEWKQDKKDGYGEYVDFSTGATYIGYWSKGKREGQGTYVTKGINNMLLSKCFSCDVISELHHTFSFALFLLHSC
jgi:hypothetical protein